MLRNGPRPTKAGRRSTVTTRRAAAYRLSFALLLSAAVAGGARAQDFASVAAGTGVSAQRASTPSTIAVSAVLAVGLTVSDMDRSLDFYTKVLSVEKVSDVEV